MYSPKHRSLAEESTFPDGLTPDVIDALLREAHAHWAVSARPTSALMDGSAEQRRERRSTRRQMGAVVRALPVRVVAAADDEAA